jgi:hypothetical protein
MIQANRFQEQPFGCDPREVSSASSFTVTKILDLSKRILNISFKSGTPKYLSVTTH